MAFILYSTFLFALQTTFYHIQAMPTVYVATMPDKCRNQTFCTSDSNYPQDIVDRLVKEKNLSFSIRVNQYENISTEIVNRQGTDDFHPCKAVHELRKDIRYIVDERNNLRVVVQSKTRFRQLIPTIKCMSPEPIEDGNLVHDTFLKTYKTNIKCVESKLNFNFVVLTLDLQSFETAKVINGGVPVGCQCRYVE